MTERGEQGAEGSEIARWPSHHSQHLVGSLKSNPDSPSPFRHHKIQLYRSPLFTGGVMLRGGRNLLKKITKSASDTTCDDKREREGVE